MKTYYELLEIEPSASADAVKHAFRRQISRYHPDKVEHLGPEFREIAAVRAAELTEAYRALIDENARREYDESIREPTGPAPWEARAREARHAGAPKREAPVGPDSPPDRHTQQVRATSDEVIKKGALARLREAVTAVNGIDQPVAMPGFDAAFAIGDKGGLFRKARAGLVVLVKYAPLVDASMISAVWRPAMRTTRDGDTVCVLLIGGSLAPASTLAAAIAGERQKARRPGPVLIPVDVRNWDALFPPEAPAPVRAILQRLRAGTT